MKTLVIPGMPNVGAYAKLLEMVENFDGDPTRRRWFEGSNSVCLSSAAGLGVHCAGIRCDDCVCYLEATREAKTTKHAGGVELLDLDEYLERKQR